MAIILASGSPRRQALLRKVGVSEFQIHVPNVREEADAALPPDKMVKVLARKKASASSFRPGDVVIAADTVVVLDGRVLGKPKNRADAERMLSLLSGRRHQVYTGVAVKKDEELLLSTEKTNVYFRTLLPGEIKAYAATGEPDDKAGAYGVQERGALFVEKIEGDYYNVMGLPLCMLSRMLLTFGINLLTGEGM
ncbi:MAG: Maf family protein [Oscillospiraceae bacterium]|nr:Maf family protein [Oscillospiraceae bacterium]